MPQTTTTKPMAATERLARAALELHRLALAATEIRYLPSPATPREKNSKGAADPTAGTALDDRRKAVAEALANVEQAVTLVADELGEHAHYLTSTLDRWDGK